MKCNELDDGMTSDELRAREIREMDPELKERWVNALRSGSYKQGEGYLRRRNVETNEDSFCCLGVLCNLTDPEHWELDTVEDYYPVNGESVAIYHLGASGLPTSGTLEDWGLFNAADKLAQMNDAGYSFEQIARYLEGDASVEDERPEHVKEALDPH